MGTNMTPHTQGKCLMLIRTPNVITKHGIILDGKTLTNSARKTSSQAFDRVLNTTLKISFFKTRKNTTINENAGCLQILILNFNFT